MMDEILVRHRDPSWFKMGLSRQHELIHGLILFWHSFELDYYRAAHLIYRYTIMT